MGRECISKSEKESYNGRELKVVQVQPQLCAGHFSNTFFVATTAVSELIVKSFALNLKPSMSVQSF